MSRYIVIIECSEKFVYEIEADDEDYAIAEAFENRYAWRNSHEADNFNVTVKKVGDAE